MTVTFHTEELDNGLKIIGERDSNAHTSAAGFWVSTGARDEDPGIMGVSHFLEHMMFKGTAKRTAEDVNREFDAIGAVNNAFTSAEMTAYWAHMLPENMSPKISCPIFCFQYPLNQNIAHNILTWTQTLLCRRKTTL